MHTLICVTFSLPPGVGDWLRLLLVAVPGLICLPFFVVRILLRNAFCLRNDENVSFDIIFISFTI